MVILHLPEEMLPVERQVTLWGDINALEMLNAYEHADII